MSTRFFRDNLWRWKCGLPEVEHSATTYTQEEVVQLYRTQWCDRFEELCRNRMVFGTFRYGDYKLQKVNYDRISSIERRIQLYKETGNDELLVDVSNLCMIEFEVGKHPNKHFASIDDGEHVKPII